jgi:MFS family permease
MEFRVTQRDSRLFYGWVVVGVSFLTQFLIAGTIFYSLAIVLTDLADEFSGGQRAPILAIQLAAGISTAAMGPFIGRLAGSGRIRGLMVVGAASTGLGLIALAYATTLWQLWLIFGTLLAFGGNTLSGITASTLVVNWFEERRATALGVSQLGSSMGGMVLVPIFASIVASSGWRGAYELMGYVLLGAIVLIAWLVVDRPEDRGELPDGKPATPGQASLSGDAEKEDSKFRTLDALKERNLWLIVLATGFSFMATTAILNNIVAYGTDAGFSAASAAWLVSIAAGGAAAGKLVFGWLSDRIGPSSAFAISLSAEAVGLAALTAVEGYGVVVGLVFFTGVAFGGTLPLSSAILAACFGREKFGPMMGLMFPLAIPLQLSGPIYAGWIYDSTGSYDLAFWSFTAVLFLAAGLVRLVRPAADLAPA